jgi:hypothetical protein
MKRFVVSAVSVALSVVGILGIPSSARAQDCSHTCAAFPVDDAYGTIPAGTQLTVVASPAVSGTGDIFCQTCTVCSVSFSISFYGHSTGYLGTFNHGGAGWSTPQDHPSRPGELKAICDATDWVDFEIGTVQCR